MDQSPAMQTVITFITTYGIQAVGAIVILIIGKIAAGVCANVLLTEFARGGGGCTSPWESTG